MNTICILMISRWKMRDCALAAFSTVDKAFAFGGSACERIHSKVGSDHAWFYIYTTDSDTDVEIRGIDTATLADISFKK